MEVKIMKMIARFREKPQVDLEETTNAKINKNKKTTEQYIEELSIKNNTIIPLDEYITSQTKIHHYCLKCGYVWEVAPITILRNHGCPICALEKISTSRKLDYNNVVGRIQTQNPYVLVLSKDYISSADKFQCQCKICGYIWNSRVSNLMKGHGCPKCAPKINGEKKRKTPEQFSKQIYDNFNGTIILNEEYTTAANKISATCTVCNYSWKPQAHSLEEGYGCPKCAGNAPISNDEFVERVKDTKNPSLIIKSEYIDSSTYIDVECTICHYEWEMKPANIQSGNGCPKCRRSLGELRIEKFLIDNNINFNAQKTYSGLVGIKGNLLSYDFYLPQYNLLTEFQGEQHERPIEFFGGEERFQIQQEHDKRKRNYAKLHNINLLEIWYYDIDQIEEILEETINNLKLESVETVGCV